MGDFVTANRPLPPPKTDAFPPQGQVGELDASDINDIWGALADVRTGIGFPNRTVVSDTDYSVNATDYMIAFTQLTASRVVTLPSASAGLRQIIIKDESGAATSGIKIAVRAQPGETVDGTASPTTLTVIIQPFGSAALYSNGVEWRTLYSDNSLTFRTASNIRYAAEFAVGSSTGGLAEAYADGPSTGVTIIMGLDITIASPQTISLVAGKDLIIDMNARRLTFSHSSGVGLTFAGSLLRQIFVIKNGTVVGNSNTGITGLKLSAVLAPALTNLVFTGFNGTNQIATVYDNSQDGVAETVQWLFNNNTGTIALDLTNSANANAWHGCQFNNNYQAIRMRGAASGNWFSDCLIQSQVGPNAVVVQVTGSDTTIYGTQFYRCWFEDNGDGTANSSSIYFNTDAGKTILATGLIGNVFNGNTHGSSGVALRFAATGAPGSYLTTTGNWFGGYATIQGGWDTTVTQICASIGNADTTATERFTVGFNSGGDIGLLFKPPGAAATWQMYAGYVNNDDGFFKMFRNGSYIGGVNTGSNWGWGGTPTGNNILIGSGGKIFIYNGINTAGNGVPSIHGTPVLLTGQVANLAATNVYASAPVGEYRLSATARTTTSGTGTTATLNIIWTDEGGVKTLVVGTWALNSVTVTGQIQVSVVIHAAAATNIQVSVTAGTYGTSVYALSAFVERIN